MCKNAVERDAWRTTLGLGGARAHGTGEQHSAHDEQSEGRYLQRALHAVRKLLAEDDETRGDGDGVRGKGRQAGSGQGVRMLEGALENAGSQAVEDDERRDRREPRAGIDGELRRDVAPREEQPCGQP